MKRTLFGTTASGKAVHQYTLENAQMSVDIIDYGAAIRGWTIKKLQRDIVLGFDTVAAYESSDAHMGASVGRVANRLADASYTWQGTVHTLTPNDGKNLLHSGKAGCASQVWTYDETVAPLPGADAVTLRTVLRGADDGFPGDVNLAVTYALVDHTLHVTYEYVTSTDSFVNVTNHAYFNLDGTDTVANHTLTLQADRYTPMDAAQIPTGEVASVAGTPFDFTKGATMGDSLTTYAKELAALGGYDHNFVVHTNPVQPVSLLLSEVATVAVPDLTMTIATDAPCFQYYTGNGLDEIGKGGRHYGAHAGLCIEPQFIPNDINLAGWQQSITTANQTYRRQMAFTIMPKGEEE